MASGSLCPSPYQTVLDTNGNPVSGAKITTTLAGTSTPVATYTDQALTVPNANPIIADSAGRYVAFLTPGVGYKFAIADAASVPIRTVDGILAAPATPFNVASGGTGATTFNAHGVLIGEGTSAITATGAGTAGQVVTSNGASADPTFQNPQLDNGLNDFRLTLESGVPVSSTDQLAKTTLYCTPWKGNRLALYDSGGAATIYSSAEFSIAVPNAASQAYSVFAFNNAGVPTLEVTAWTNDTTPGPAAFSLSATTGSRTKTGDLTRRYLGCFRTTTVAGQTEDSVAKKLVQNDTNRVLRVVRRMETTASWNYSIATIRQANGAAANQIELMNGVADGALHLEVAVHASNTTGTSVGVYIGIGQDSTTALVAGQVGGEAYPPVTGLVGLRASLDIMPAIGRHFYAWLEYATATGTTTWYGSNLATLTAGISGLWSC